MLCKDAVQKPGVLIYGLAGGQMKTVRPYAMKVSDPSSRYVLI